MTSCNGTECINQVVGRILDDPCLLNECEYKPLRELILSLGGSVPEKRSVLDPEIWCLSSSEMTDYYVAVGSFESNVSDDASGNVEMAQQLKEQAARAVSEGNFQQAIVYSTDALKLCPRKAPYWAARSVIYQKWKKAECAIKDATTALEFNAENATALRSRGKCRRYIGQYEDALADLNAANRVDFDPDSSEMIKWLEEQVAKSRCSKKSPDCNPPKENPQAVPCSPKLPPGMESLFSDPDIQEAFKDPETAQKLQGIMANPMSAMQYLSDPKISGLMQKMMGKMGGLGGLSGMAGMGGFPFPGGFPGAGSPPTSNKGASNIRQSGSNDDLD